METIMGWSCNGLAHTHDDDLFSRGSGLGGHPREEVVAPPENKVSAAERRIQELEKGVSRSAEEPNAREGREENSARPRARAERAGSKPRRRAIDKIERTANRPLLGLSATDEAIAKEFPHRLHQTRVCIDRGTLLPRWAPCSHGLEGQRSVTDVSGTFTPEMGHLAPIGAFEGHKIGKPNIIGHLTSRDWHLAPIGLEGS
nr:hypothetical protein Iba_chr09eCG14620 [Ipomoea batatas]